MGAGVPSEEGWEWIPLSLRKAPSHLEDEPRLPPPRPNDDLAPLYHPVPLASSLCCTCLPGHRRAQLTALPQLPSVKPSLMPPPPHPHETSSGPRPASHSPVLSAEHS